MSSHPSPEDVPAAPHDPIEVARQRELAQVPLAELRTVKGNPSDEDIAAFGTVLAALIEAGQSVDAPRDTVVRRSDWHRSLRQTRRWPPIDNPWRWYGR